MMITLPSQEELFTTEERIDLEAGGSWPSSVIARLLNRLEQAAIDCGYEHELGVMLEHVKRAR